MRPMTQAETAKVNAILASSPPAPTASLTPCFHADEALLGSTQHARTIEDFLLTHDEISREELDAFSAHLRRCFPDREITVEIYPDDDSTGILVFSIYGFSEQDQVDSAEEDAFYDEFPSHLDHLAGPVTIFPRTGPYLPRAAASPIPTRRRPC